MMAAPPILCDRGLVLHHAGRESGCISFGFKSCRIALHADAISWYSTRDDPLDAAPLVQVALLPTAECRMHGKALFVDSGEHSLTLKLSATSATTIAQWFEQVKQAIAAMAAELSAYMYTPSKTVSVLRIAVLSTTHAGKKQPPTFTIHTRFAQAAAPPVWTSARQRTLRQLLNLQRELSSVRQGGQT